MTGALAITTMSMAPSFAADTDSTETSTLGVAEADEATTIIVQLAAGSVGDDRASAYKDIKQRIARSVSQASPGGTIGDVRDYHHALDGFAITAPASTLGAIKSVQGVKDAFVDGQREPVFYPEMSGDGGAAVADPAKETRSDQVAGRGRGSVIEVIDASFDTSHEAFAGTMDTAALRLPQAEMASLTSQLDAGQGGAWISDKIPFVYDYADRDTNPYIGDGYGPQDYTVHAHGTRMAALAAANGVTYRGGAPDAQLILAKVLSNSTRTVRDSDMLAALDDAMVIKPDTVCVAFMANRDLGGDAEALYDDVFARLSSAGITVDAPAGDSGRAEWRTGVRDLGDVGAPAAYSSVLAVAAVGGSALQGIDGLTPWSSFSWGPGPDMSLKPEIAAPGGNVNAAIPGKDYRRMPGTGEASAQVAGVAALVCQRMATDPMFAPEPTPTPLSGQWVSDSIGWWYRYADGSYPAGQKVRIGDSMYRFDARGYMRTGWVSEDGAWFYHDASGAQASGWVKDGSTWYYLDPASGRMVTGWLLDGSTWYYLTPSGAMATGWVKDGSTWYYLRSSGAMATGWLKDGSTWYYLRSSGAMATGWLMDGGSWYYLSTDSGAMYTGGHWIGWKWYYFNESGQWNG